MERPIDRKNKFDVLEQISQVWKDIAKLNRKACKHQHEIDSWPKKKEQLENQKKSIARKISKKHHYIKQLEKDLEELVKQ